MRAYGKNWRLVDDPICDVGDWDSVPVDCTDCEYFFECYEEDDEEDKENENVLTVVRSAVSPLQSAH